jgi:hypothetical protein
MNLCLPITNRIGDVMVCVIALSAVDRGFEPEWFKAMTIKMVCVASPLRTQHEGVRVKTGWLGIRTMCPSGATCLPADCCFSQLAL